VREHQSLGSVVAALRRMDEADLLTHHFAFVVDSGGRLVGQIPLLKMLLSNPSAHAGEVMNTDFITTSVLEDQEKVANLFRKRDLLSLGVVDAAGRMVGRITVDDVMDVMSEEATEDMARFAGSSEEEVGETSILRISRARMPWLLLGLMGQILSAFVMSHFGKQLQARVILAFFVPMVMATGGNIGIQTSSIVIRLLATEEFDRFRVWRHLVREILVGLMNGALLGAIMMTLLRLGRQETEVGLVIGLSLMAVVLIASSVATLVPLALHRFHIDPTLATGPFITTMNDILGILVYLGLANYLLSHL
jgi:magnesium transporter